MQAKKRGFWINSGYYPCFLACILFNTNAMVSWLLVFIYEDVILTLVVSHQVFQVCDWSVVTFLEFSLVETVNLLTNINRVWPTWLWRDQLLSPVQVQSISDIQFVRRFQVLSWWETKLRQEQWSSPAQLLVSHWSSQPPHPIPHLNQPQPNQVSIKSTGISFSLCRAQVHIRNNFFWMIWRIVPYTCSSY